MAFRFETLNVWNQSRTFSALLIAEGSALPSRPLFSHRLGLAQGEIAEVACGAYLAFDRGYLDEIIRASIYDSAQSLARQIDGLRKSLR